MIGLILIILIVFSVVWLFVWLWFFKGGRFSGKNMLKSSINAFEQGNYKKAKELLLKIPDTDTNSETKYKLGLVHLKLSEYDNAKSCFEQVLKTSPKNFDALFNLAQILQLQEKYDESIEMYARAAKENNKNIECSLNIGDIYYEQGSYDKALEVLEKVKEIAPDNIQLLFSIVKCKSELCDMENEAERQQIIDEYTKLAENANLLKNFNISFAKVHAKIGNVLEAFKYCKDAIEANGEDIEAYKLLGLINLIQNDLPGAKNSLSIALNFQSNNVEIHHLLSYLFCIHEKGCALQQCRDKYYELVNKQHLKKQ